MVVYAEYLFLENFITGVLILYFTAQLAGNCHPAKSTVWRLAAGGALCGVSGFMLFLPLNVTLGLLLRCAAAFAITAAALGKRDLLKKTEIFLIISFLSSGIAMALFLWMQIPAMSGNGIMYVEAVTFLQLICCGIPAMALCSWFIKLVRRHSREKITCGEVELEVGGRSCRMKAYVDTGNCLREPVTGKPVILVDQKGSGRLGFCREEFRERYTVIPYKAVGVSGGLLEGIRLDRVRFGNKTITGVVLAYYSGSFQGFDVLLNRELLEGGLLEHA